MRKKNLYKLSLSKEIFEDILLIKTQSLRKKSTKYWKKELFEPKIIENKIIYELKVINKLLLSNGLGDEKPFMIIECNNITYSKEEDSFIFELGKILEQKNTTLGENYKDNLIEQLLKEKEVLRNDMSKDYLTNTFNRRKMEMDLDIFINDKNKDLLTSIFIDIDNFKKINEKYGYEIGDKVLINLSKKLEKHAKLLNGTVYRYGNDEFVIFCFIEQHELILRLNELKEDIKSEITYNLLGDILVTISIGVSFFSESSSKTQMLYSSQDAVNKAKNDGMDRIYLNTK